MTKVLHLLTALGPGGAETWLLNMIEPLRERGFDLGFVLKAPELGNLEYLAHERHSPTYHVRFTPTPLHYVRDVSRIVRDEGYSIVHTHEFVHSGLGVLVAERARVPLVSTLHHWVFEPQTKFTRRIVVREIRGVYGRISLAYTLRRATFVTTLSRAVMNRIVPGWDGPRFRLLQLSVVVPDLATAEDRRQLRAEIGWSEDADVIVHVGRFIEQKNHVGLLRMFAKIHQQRSSTRLLLLGQGPLLDEIRVTAARLSCNSAIHFGGVRKDIPNVLAASDLLLFPSLHEGFGLVALEANGAGIPVVGSRIDGLDEAVVDGETAILLPLDDESAFVRCVLELLESPERAHALGSRGRARASRDFSHDASANRLATLYSDCLATR